MRFFSRPPSGIANGSTLSASQEPPGRSGASHSSQASPSAIRPSRLPTASQRVAETEEGMAAGAFTAGASVGRAPGWQRPDGMIPAMNRRQLWRDLSYFPWGNTAAVLGERFREERLGLTASSLTFTTTIAMVPFFTVALALFTVFTMFAKLQGGLQR